ncbi:putative sister chromatid cohesion protein Ctf8 [Xylaria bambusicola]|uniref:putative sister chromatid cohesion protein Ctf8 n=1 Tax=Xylaria bambusicola TaxID=326684 RepID=UPI002008AFD3|nr:putative sister chromatid cohesion protein Ctf8 [Xylaria bambusicola]KAI0506587.1 putative sister chromatid cohesion protein Ctf8 [Xylaria bambusicola]
MASSVTLHLRTPTDQAPSSNPFPQLIHTPSGLAILELQGTINLPQSDQQDSEGGCPELEIGRISFPDYHPETQDASSTAWMKRVHLYVGQHQRLTGEVKKLPRAMAIIRKRQTSNLDVETAGPSSEDAREDLEVVEIVKYKLMFSHRPEPVGRV